MKKLLYGLGLFLGGVIGFVGWACAVTQSVEHGARSTVFACFGEWELLFLLVFAVMAIVGLLIAHRAAKSGES